MAVVQQISRGFPEFFVANKDKYLGEILEIHGKHPDEYNLPMPPPQTNEGLAPLDEGQAILRKELSTNIIQ